MKSQTILAAATIVGLIFATGSTNANQKLSLRVTPNVSSAPSTVVVRAYVTPNAVNRVLQIEADSGSFYRSSQVQLDGDKAPTLNEFRLNSLPGGEYVVTAVLKDNLGEETIVRQTALVIGRFGEPGQ